MKLREMLSDFLVLAGCAAIVYGAWLLSTPAAWITGGVILVIIGTAIGLEGLHK